MSKYIAYTDGSANNMSPEGEGGAAYIIFDEEMNEVKRNAKGFLHVTNNFCEEIAIVSAMMSVPDGSHLLVITDSKLAINLFQNHNIKNLLNVCAKLWCKNIGKRKVEFEWVKGHNGNEWNELCDKMAGEKMLEIRKKYNIPTYSRKNSPKVKKKTL